MAGNQSVRRRRSTPRIRDTAAQDVAADHLGGSSFKTDWTPHSPRKPRNRSRSSEKDTQTSTSPRQRSHSRKPTSSHQQNQEADAESPDAEPSDAVLLGPLFKEGLRWTAKILISLFISSAIVNYISGSNPSRLLEIVRDTALDIQYVSPGHRYHGVSSLDYSSRYFAKYEEIARHASNELKGPKLPHRTRAQDLEFDDKIAMTLDRVNETKAGLNELVQKGRNNTYVISQKLQNLLTGFQKAKDLSVFSPACSTYVPTSYIPTSYCLRQHPSERAKLLADSFFDFLSDNPHFDDIKLYNVRRRLLEVEARILTDKAEHVRTLAEKQLAELERTSVVGDAGTSRNEKRKEFELAERWFKERKLLIDLERAFGDLKTTANETSFSLAQSAKTFSKHQEYAAELHSLERKDVQLGFEQLDFDKEVSRFALDVQVMKEYLDSEPNGRSRNAIARDIFEGLDKIIGRPSRA